MVNITERADGSCLVAPDPLYELRFHTQVFNYIVTAIWFMFSIPVVVLYIARRNHPYIRKRHLPYGFVVSMYTAVCCSVVINPIRSAVGIPNFSCILFLVASQAVVPLCGLPLIMRIFLFTREASRALTLEKISFAGFASYFATERQQRSNVDGLASGSPLSFASSALESGEGDLHEDGDGNPAATTYNANTGASFSRKFDGNMGNHGRPSDLGTAYGYGSDDGGSVSVYSILNKSEITRAIAQATSTTWSVLLVPLVVAAVFLSLTGYFLSLEQYRKNCLGCELGLIAEIVFMVATVFISLAMVYGFQKAKSYLDPLDIKRDILRSIKVGVPVGIFGFLMSALDPGELDARGHFAWGFFIFLGLAIAWCFQVIPPLRKSYLQVGRIATGGNLLHEILRDPLGVEAFRKHLVTEHSAELIRFVNHVSKWKRLFGRKLNEVGPDHDKDNNAAVDETNRITYAYEIYNLFIADHAPLFVNIGHELRQPILKAFAFIEEGKFAPDSPDQVPDNIFDDALLDVKVMLENDSLPRFLKTKGYKEWAGC